MFYLDNWLSRAPAGRTRPGAGRPETAGCRIRPQRKRGRELMSPYARPTRYTQTDDRGRASFTG
jgi:hypothetical protein